MATPHINIASIKIDGYDGIVDSTAPAAAKFGRGANDLAGVRDATDLRRAHTRAITDYAASHDHEKK
jgi:hypothetical protein